MLDDIVMQMRKVNRKKHYYLVRAKCEVDGGTECVVVCKGSAHDPTGKYRQCHFLPVSWHIN